MDAKLRRLETRGDPAAALLARLRAGLVGVVAPPGEGERRYEVLGERACRKCRGVGNKIPWLLKPSDACEPCRGTGRVPADPWDVVRLRAFCGDEAARVLAGEPVRAWTPGVHRWDTWAHKDEQQTLAALLHDLKALAAALPLIQGSGPCDECDEENLVIDIRKGSEVGRKLCPDCKGTGRWAWAVGTAAWIMAAAAVRVGWEVWRAQCTASNATTHSGSCSCCAPGRALDAAAAAWVDCPCEVHRQAWRVAYLRQTRGWCPCPGGEHASVLAASRQPGMTEAAVRDLVRAEWLKRTTG